MNQFMAVFCTLAVLGSAIVGGIFFAFSSFVMKALERVPSSEGIAAMQSINVVVINPSFLGVFMGTALLSLGMGGLALAAWDHPSAPFLLAGAILYLVGTFLVTALGNVPLNNELAAVSASQAAAAQLWDHYLERWTMLNHVRTGAAILATLLFSMALTRLGGA